MTHHGKSLFTMHVLFHNRIHIRYFTLFHFITSRILKIEIIDMNTNYLSLYTSLHFVKRSLFNGKSQFISIPPQMIKTMIHSVIPLYFTIALHNVTKHSLPQQLPIWREFCSTNTSSSSIQMHLFGVISFRSHE